MRPDAEHIVHNWFSPAYPVGAFAYSHGLEHDIARGAVSDAAALADWVHGVLYHGSGRADVILMRAVHAGAPPELAGDLALALAASKERALETRALGAAFAKVTAAQWGTPDTPHPYPVAVGLAARTLGLPAPLLARLYLHGMAANLISVAVRFMPLGQTAGQQVLAGLFPVIDTIVLETEAAGLDDIQTATFGADLASIEHERLQTRLYRS